MTELAPSYDPTPLNSASQISTWDACNRKWGFTYLAGFRSAQTPAQMLGDEVDTGQLQPYFRDERPFDFTMNGNGLFRAGLSADIATTALEFLPKPKSSEGMEVQKHLTMPAMTARTPEGHAVFGYQGFIDLWHPENGMGRIPDIPMPLGDRTPVVIDFKTTSDLKWAKTAEQLKVDPQAMLYATWAMFSTGARAVDLVWIYMQTKGALRSRRSYVRVFGEQIAEFFPVLDALATETLQVRDACGERPEAEAIDFVIKELKPNASACEAYGGCPFRSRCNLSPSSIFDSLNAKQFASGGKPQMSSVTDLLAKMKAKKAGTAAATPAPSTSTPGVNPPESTLPPAAPVNVAPPPPAPATAPATEAPAAKRGPGRPRKAPAASAADAPAAAAEAPSTTIDGGTGFTKTAGIDLDALATLIVERLADTLAKGLTK